jgi:cell division protein FtsI (penicillin-binding protein 3)
VNLSGALGGQVIVMDSDTGDVIAMATVVRERGVAVVSSGNWSAVGAYEPGSVGKIISVAGALEDGAVTPGTSYVVPWEHDCTRNPNDGVLHDSHMHDPLPMSVRDILVESSNVGTIYVAQEIGYERLHHYITAFGLGERTALGFPGESNGLLKPWPEWEGTERCTMAYGQGYAATPIQMTAAMNVIANDGTYVAPRLVLGTVGADGEITDAEPSATRPVVSPETATEMQTILRDVVCDERGTAREAQVEGLSVAGKTGTAYKVLDNGTYTDDKGKHKYYVSFAGFFPAEDPQVTVLVSVDEPPTGTSGGQTAAPLFREIVPTIIHELGIEPPPGSTDCDGAS